MKTDKLDLKKMTKDMIAQKVKSKLKEFYNEDNKKYEQPHRKINNQPKFDTVEEEDDESEISEYEEELTPEIVNDKNNIEKQTQELNYFSLNAIGIFIGIALIILFFIIRYFCCCKS